MKKSVKSFLLFIFLFFPVATNAEKINLNKEINLFELSQKYQRCKNDTYRDDCYDIHREKHFSKEGYWKKNRLWEGINRNEILDKVTHKIIDGIDFDLDPDCFMNLKGWYSCTSGDKYKPIRNGRFDQLDNKQGQFIYKWKSGDIYEGNYKDDLNHGYGKLTWRDYLYWDTELEN